MNIYDNVAGIKSTFRSCRIQIVQQSPGSNMRGACVGFSLLMLAVTINGCHRNRIAQSSEEKSGGPLANMCDLTLSVPTRGLQINPEDLLKKLDMVDKDGDGMVSRDEFQNIVQQPLQEEQLDHIWKIYTGLNVPLMKYDLLRFWNTMCKYDGHFRKVLCLRNGNYFGKKFTNHDLFDVSGSHHMCGMNRFLINDYNGDGTVDENDQEKIINLYCDGEIGTKPPSISALP